jgi:hypothetical protein
MRILWSFKRKSGPRKPKGSQAWINAPDAVEETLGNVVLWGRGGRLPNGTIVFDAPFWVFWYTSLLIKKKKKKRTK